MKQTIVILLMLLVDIGFCYADSITTIYTRGGKPIEVIIRDEMSQEDIQFYNAAICQEFSEATFLASSSRTYNCHSYAWNLTDGGTVVCWINDSVKNQQNIKVPNLSKYWTNDYYEETTSNNASRIHYYLSNHSAVVSQTVPGMYESKWGKGPVMRHAPGYGPYDYMNYRKYYAHIVPTPIYGILQCSNISNYIGVNVPASYLAGGISYSNMLNSNYTITDNKGEDAVDNGKAVINQTYYNGLNITFTHTGIYEIAISFYNQFNECLGEYNYEQIVQ